MLYLLLSVTCSSFIFVILKLLAIRQIPSTPTILLSYAFGVLAGIANLPADSSLTSISLDTPWLPMGMIIGLFYITCLLLINGVTREYGATTSVIASRLSLAIPVAFSLWIFEQTMGQATLGTYMGLSLALVALLLSSYSRTPSPNRHKGMGLLPLILFITAGALDVITNYANIHYVKPADAALFSIVIFATAALASLLVLVVRPRPFNRYNVAFGIALGLVNYFGTYFSLLGLHAFDNNGSLFFPIWNMAVILLTSTLGVLLFKEPLNRYRRMGILLALVAIGVLSQS